MPEELAIIEGTVIRSDTGEGIMSEVITVRDQTQQQEIVVGYTDSRGEFSVLAPVGQKYFVCAMGQSFQPVCIKLTDQEGAWVELPKDGFRIRIETVPVSLIQ